MEIKDLFLPAVYAEFIGRIELIRPELKPLWGKMNAAQMLTHVAEPFRIANGDVKPRMEWRGRIFGCMLKGLVTKPEPYPKNSPTSRDFIFPEDVGFVNSKALLIKLLNRFHLEGPEGVTTGPHPFFGKLTTVQWNSAMSKHLDHHLTQFGA